MNIPIYNALYNYSRLRPVPFHMPGHKLGKGIPSALLRDLNFLDLTEIPGLDNLHYPGGIIKEAQELAATAFGADQTFFLVNGSTCGIQAAIMTLCRPGDKLIAARDCHRSAVGGMILSGTIPVYIKPEFDMNFGIPTVIKISEIEEALKKNPDAVGVYITRPSYYGVCSDIEAVCKLVHSYNKVLIVDEAHGAHLRFSKKLPSCALDYGADICIQSAHKTLPAFTQGAYLHVKGHRIDIEKLKSNLALLQTSSPSYIIMAFLDIARAIMEERGEDSIDGLIKSLDWLNETILGSTSYKILSDGEIKTGEVDKTRVVINVRSIGRSGYEVEDILRSRYNIQVEMADLYNIVCITTIADNMKDFEKLYSALHEINNEFYSASPLKEINIKDLSIPPQKVELNKLTHLSSVRKKLFEAVGMVSKGMITPYPPGIPLICPGEAITEDAAGYIGRIIEAGGVVNGVSADLEVEVVK
ncbi:MAG: aminotransferase class I/II-fold pyridoxal phosphate-dependent enzyme [Bacillota bacterium]